MGLEKMAAIDADVPKQQLLGWWDSRCVKTFRHFQVSLFQQKKTTLRNVYDCSSAAIVFFFLNLVMTANKMSRLA